MADGTATITRPRRRRPVFHALPVAQVQTLTDDAVAIGFGVPDDLRETFAFTAGQHLTVRRLENGEDVRRSYSICSTPTELAERGLVRIGVKRIPGGTFSSFATAELRTGDLVEVLAPLGHFTTDFDSQRIRHYAAIVAGSGITPALSLIATALAVETGSRFTVLYGNRFARSVMFAEELADLKDRYPARLHLVHVLSREPQDAQLLSGRLDRAKLAALFDQVVDVATVDDWFLCGPYGMIVDARAELAGRGVADSTVHTELFHVDDAAAPTRPRAESGVAAGAAEVTIMLDGRASTFTMSRDQRVLDAALAVRGELPYACKGGVCSTCRAKVIDGRVEMVRNFALEPDEVAAGYVLTCQSQPVTDKVTVDYDA